MDEEELMREIVGEVDMVGEDEDEDEDDDEVGGNAYDMVGGRKKKRRAPRGRVKGLRRPRDFIWRRQTLGLVTAAAIVAGASGSVIARPQRPFKGKRLVVTSDVCFFFTLPDIKVGQNSQNVASGVLPGGMFSEQAVNAFVDWDTADLGNEIQVFFTNVDALAHVFNAGVIGLVAQAQY